jgi:hypothetical protein
MQRRSLVVLSAGYLVGCAGLVGLGDALDFVDGHHSWDGSASDVAESDVHHLPDANAESDAGANADEGGDATASADGDARADADADVNASEVDARLDAPTTISWSNGFETAADRRQWFITGNAGIDIGAGFAHSGSDNGWVNTAVAGWNAINTIQSTGPATQCQVSAWIAASNTLVPGRGFFAVWDVKTVNGVPPSLNQAQLAPGNNGGYIQYAFSFTPPADGQVVIDVGIWGINDQIQWVRVDDFTLTCT